MDLVTDKTILVNHGAMQTQIRHRPGFAVARLFLEPGEPVQVQSGSMMAHSVGIMLDSKVEGGFMAGLKRSVLSGESFFVSTITAPPHGGWVDVTSVLPGDIIEMPVQPNRPMFITRGCWLAHSYGVQTTTQWGGSTNLFGGEGGFGMVAQGQGVAVLSVYGALDVMDLEPGVEVTIDTGHVVAYDMSIQFRLRQAAQGGLWKSMTSGEGMVFDFMGPGRIYLQSRSTAAFEGYILALVPTNRS